MPLKEIKKNLKTLKPGLKQKYTKQPSDTTVVDIIAPEIISERSKSSVDATFR